MNTDFRSAPATAGFAPALPALARVTRCEREGFEGHPITTQRTVMVTVNRVCEPRA